MARPGADLVDGWETLLVAALSPGRKVRGIVHLNKVLARLQRRGFPVPITFRILPMGPASVAVESRANTSTERGFLEQSETPTRPDYKDRKDWELTDAGFEYVRKEIVPAIGDDEAGRLSMEVLQEELREMRHKSGNALKEESHEALVLDDPELFQERYETAIDDLREWSRHFAEDHTPRSDAELTAAAAVDLALMALEEEKERAVRWFSPSAGIRHVFWNAERLVTVLEDLRTEEAMDESRWEDEADEFEIILRALEWNCELYGIVSLPTEEEIEQAFWEAEPFDPDAVTY